MGQHSGRFGALSGIGSVRNWSINDAQELSKQVASNTGQGTASSNGVNDWTGNFNVFGKTLTAMPGDTVAFVGFTAPDNDASGVGLRYSGNCLITQLAAMWNWTAGEVLSLAYDFGGHLALTPGAAGAAVTDATPLDAPLVALTKIQYSVDNGSNFVDWTALSQAVLTITNQVQTYVDSDTVVNSVIWTGRKKGVTNFTVAITEHNTDRARFIKGQQLILRMFVNATLFYELKWVKVKDFAGLVVNRDTGAIMQQTVNLEMNMNDDGVVSATPGVLGHVLLPDASVWLGV